MLRRYFLAILIGLEIGFACSPAPYPAYRYEPVEPEGVRLIRTRQEYAPGPPGQGFITVPVTDTMGVYFLEDFKASVREQFLDSPLVFLGRFDSVITDASTRSPDIDLPIVPAPDYERHSALLRMQIDTVLNGTFPHSARPVWVKVYAGAATCMVGFSYYLNKPFFNVSTGFAAMRDLRVNFPLFIGWEPYPEAMWFDGRYLRSPDFPGLKLDITEIFATYPATGILRRHPSLAPMKSGDKGYLPDGRRAPESSEPGRKVPRPVLK